MRVKVTCTLGSLHHVLQNPRCRSNLNCPLTGELAREMFLHTKDNYWGLKKETYNLTTWEIPQGIVLYDLRHGGDRYTTQHGIIDGQTGALTEAEVPRFFPQTTEDVGLSYRR